MSINVDVLNSQVGRKTPPRAQLASVATPKPSTGKFIVGMLSVPAKIFLDIEAIAIIASGKAPIPIAASNSEYLSSERTGPEAIDDTKKNTGEAIAIIPMGQSGFMLIVFILSSVVSCCFKA